MQKGRFVGVMVMALALILQAGCKEGAWNNPWPAREAGANVLYSSFEERPKHLDPARSYNSNEYAFLAQIYEPPLQYHFLLRRQLQNSSGKTGGFLELGCRTQNLN